MQKSNHLNFENAGIGRHFVYYHVGNSTACCLLASSYTMYHVSLSINPFLVKKQAVMVFFPDFISYSTEKRSFMLVVYPFFFVFK